MHSASAHSTDDRHDVQTDRQTHRSPRSGIYHALAVLRSVHPLNPACLPRLALNVHAQSSCLSVCLSVRPIHTDTPGGSAGARCGPRCESRHTVNLSHLHILINISNIIIVAPIIIPVRDATVQEGDTECYSSSVCPSVCSFHADF